MTRWIGILTCAALAVPAHAAQEWAEEWDVDGIEILLPRAETVEERTLRQLYKATGQPLTPAILADPPPIAPVRNCAEWEPCTGVMIRYPLGLPYTLLRDLDDQVTLHVVVSSGQQSAAQSALSGNGVDMSQVEFLVKPNDSIWTRDYGPWFVFDGNDELAIVDHVYNRPFRPNDDQTPVAFGAQQGIPVIQHDMWHTGGNYMTDGFGFSASTNLVYDEAAAENGMTAAEVNALMDDYYGVGFYNVVEDIETGGIHHIDTWGKFVDEETVILKEVWPAHYTYDDLEQRATLLASLESSTGRPYTVHRVYCHNIGGNRPASYSNSLIVNDVVYVPTFSSATNDANALAVYEAAMPGYTVLGYNYGGWLTDDALHCRTKGIMDGGMLRVAHVPVRELQGGDVTINAEVKAYSGSALSVVELVYRSDGGVWQTVAMTPLGGSAYTADIPAPATFTTTDYYVHAADASGRTAGIPRTEPAAWISFEHSPSAVSVGDAAPASIARLAPGHPNPFRASTRFSFELRTPDVADVAVYDVAGRRVRDLGSGPFPAGRSELTWDGRDDAGRSVAPGVYRLVLRTAGIVYSKPVVRAR